MASQQQLQRKARRRARRQYADDFALDVRNPRRSAQRQFAREKGSIRGAGQMASAQLSDALSGARSLGMNPHDLRAYRSELQAMQGDVPAGVKGQVISARQTMRADLADINDTAQSLRAARSDTAHDIYQNLRKNERERQQNRQDKRADQRADQKDFSLEVRKGLAKLRQGLAGDGLSHAMNVASLQSDGEARREALDRLITSDIDPKAAKKALARFMRDDPAGEAFTKYALPGALGLIRGIRGISHLGD